MKYRFDLRYVDDDEEFDSSMLKDTCNSLATATMNIDERYNGLEFECKALQLTGLKCSWDTTNDKRTKTLRRNFNEGKYFIIAVLFVKCHPNMYESREFELLIITFVCMYVCMYLYEETLKSADLEDYLASDDDDGDEDDFNCDKSIEDVQKIDILRKRLLGNAADDPFMHKKRSMSRTDREGRDEVDMEISFDAPLSGNKHDEVMTEGFKTKTKTKKSKKSRAIIDDPHISLIGVGDDELLSLSRGQPEAKNKSSVAAKKATADDKDNLKIDKRFGSLLTSPDFALDPTDPRFKKDEHAVIMKARREHVGKGSTFEKSEIQRKDVTVSAKHLANKLKNKAVFRRGYRL